MAETEGESFFVVDEPFAHFSLDRVDDIGRFLRRSGAQFLITVPTRPSIAASWTWHRRS